MQLQMKSNGLSGYQKALLKLADGLRQDNVVVSDVDYRTPDGIVRFVREVLGVEPAPYQEDILRALVIHKRVAVRGCHGLGKTALSSWVILWGMVAFADDVKIPVTASAHRQLKRFTFPEVRKWAAKTDWSKIGLQMRLNREILDLSIKLPGKETFAAASDNAALIEGAHAQHLIYVLDEAKAIPSPAWNAIEGAFSGAGADTENVAYALAISTPGESSGVFYDIHKRKPGFEDWWVRHVTIEEAIEAGRVSREWVEQRKKQWGEQSAVYQNRVLGNFAESGENSVIPLSWVEAGVDRWHALQDTELPADVAPVHGLDVARFGEDKTVLATVIGSYVPPLKVWEKQDTMQTVGRVRALINRADRIAVDVIGIGAGVVDRLREDKYKATGVNVGESAKDPTGKPMTDSSGEIEFENLRAAIWWLMREALDPDNPEALAIPPDAEDHLIGDLTAPTYDYTSRGRIRVESKDDMRKRLGRSTDYADALGLALYVKYYARFKKSPLRPFKSRTF